MEDLVAVAPIERRVAEIVRPLVEKMGFVLVRLRYGGGTRKTLQIMAERPDGSMEVDDCAEISRAVSAALDVDDPLDGSYSLEVSSPGIDRPLTRLADFEAFAGRRAKLQLLRPINGRSRFKGVVRGVAESEILLETPQGAVELPFDSLSSASLLMQDGLAAGPGLRPAGKSKPQR